MKYLHCSLLLSDAYYAFTYKLNPGRLHVHPLSTRLTHIFSIGSLSLSDFLHKSKNSFKHVRRILLLSLLLLLLLLLLDLKHCC